MKLIIYKTIIVLFNLLIIKYSLSQSLFDTINNSDSLPKQPQDNLQTLNNLINNENSNHILTNNYNTNIKDATNQHILEPRVHNNNSYSNSNKELSTINDNNTNTSSIQSNLDENVRYYIL